MSPLTPLDIENTAFRTVMRGYDRTEVDSFRAHVLAAVGEYVGLLAQYKARVAELEHQLRHYRESEELLKSSVILAQKTGDDLAAAAREKADAVIQQARLEAERMRAGLGELQAERERFEFEFHGLLRGFLEHLESRNPRLSGRPGAQALQSTPLRASSAPLLAPASAEEVSAADLLPPVDRAPLHVSEESYTSARPATAARAASAAEQAGEGRKRDLDIDEFDAALSSARPATLDFSAPAAPPAMPTAPQEAAEPWESVEPDVDEPEMDPYAEAEIDPDWADEEADWDEDADEVDEPDEHAPTLTEAAPTAQAPTAAAAPAAADVEYDDEPLTDVTLPFASVASVHPLVASEAPPAAGQPAQPAEPQASAATAEMADGTARPAGALNVQPVDDEDDDDDVPRVRRSRW